jgi:hypothetical protein
MIRKVLGALLAVCFALVWVCPAVATATKRRYCGSISYLDLTGVPSKDRVYVLRGQISCRRARHVDFEAETSYYPGVPGWRCGWQGAAFVCKNRGSTVKGVPVRFAPAASADTVLSMNP